jgi:hypothetical protein
MKQSTRVAVGTLAIAALAAGGGYWAGQRHVPGDHDEATLHAAVAAGEPARE